MSLEEQQNHKFIYESFSKSAVCMPKNLTSLSKFRSTGLAMFLSKYWEDILVENDISILNLDLNYKAMVIDKNNYSNPIKQEWNSHELTFNQGAFTQYLIKFQTIEYEIYDTSFLFQKKRKNQQFYFIKDITLQLSFPFSNYFK